MHSVMAAFQILSDAKNQMFRSTFARTVLEMAMVQLSLLENLTAISELLSGRLPTLPDMPSTSQSGAASTASLPLNTGVEKKNIEQLIPPATAPPIPSDMLPELEEDDLSDDDLDEDVAHETSIVGSNAVSLDSSPPAPSAEQKASPSAGLEVSVESQDHQHEAEQTIAPNENPASSKAGPGVGQAPAPAAPLINQSDCPRLFQELLRTVGLTISAGLKMASDLVVVGPNRLEIQLDGSYDFAKKVLDQPESRARIESELFKLTGENLSVNLRLLAPSRPQQEVRPQLAPAAAEQTKKSAENGRGRETTQKSAPPVREALPDMPPQRNLLGEVDPGQDPFVREVISVFGATVVKVTVAPAVQIEQAEMSE
jgi:hypothetical protein